MSRDRRDGSRSKQSSVQKWSKYAEEYDPIKVGSIDGTDTEPHDHGIVRAINSKYQPNERVVGNPKRTIFIGRLHTKTDEDRLKYKFKEFGKIVRCRVVRDIITGHSKRYAFIEFKHTEDARRAVKQMNKNSIDSSEVIVDYEHERLMKGWKPRRLGGGFGGRKESGQLRFGCRAQPFHEPIDDQAATRDFKELFRYQKKLKKSDSQ